MSATTVGSSKSVETAYIKAELQETEAQKAEVEVEAEVVEAEVEHVETEQVKAEQVEAEVVENAEQVAEPEAEIEAEALRRKASEESLLAMQKEELAYAAMTD